MRIEPSWRDRRSTQHRYLKFYFGVVLVLYEFFITFTEEVELFWNGKITGATVLFLANRYLTIAAQVYNLFASFLPLSMAPSKVRSRLIEFIMSWNIPLFAQR